MLWVIKEGNLEYLENLGEYKMKSPYEVIQDLLECFPKKTDKDNRNWIWYLAEMTDEEQDKIMKIVTDAKTYLDEYENQPPNCS